MAAWRILFELACRHGFFAPGRCEGLQWRPAPEAAAWLARSGTLLRPTPDGVALVGDDPARAAALAGPGAVFELALASRDPWFAAYTEGPPPGQVAVHALDDAAPDGAWTEAAAPAPASAWPLGRPGLPAAWLRIGLGPWLAAGPRRWRIAFAPRATHWKYLLPADWAVQQPEVVDPAGAVEFEPVAPAALGDGRAALVTRSRQPIPLAARPPQRFRLQARAPLADPVLVRRLPVASAGQLGLESIAGVRSLVAEIHVNR